MKLFTFRVKSQDAQETSKNPAPKNLTPPFKRGNNTQSQSAGRKIRGTKGKDKVVEDKHVTWY